MLPVGVEELTRAGPQGARRNGGRAWARAWPTRNTSRHGAEIVARPRTALWRGGDDRQSQGAAARRIARCCATGRSFSPISIFAADRQLTEDVLHAAHAVAYETFRDDQGRLPLLTPMSEVAGRMSIQEGAKYLERPQMGRGILLGGVPGVEPAHITILGGGVVGANAAKVAAGFGANIGAARYQHGSAPLPRRHHAAECHRAVQRPAHVREQLRRADLVIGSVLVPGAKAPRLIEREDLRLMKPGSVIIDVAIDQGGCVATSRPTTHSEPTYIVDDVVHYCVTNMPGAVGRTSTYALCNVTLPWALQIANRGLPAAELAARRPGHQSLRRRGDESGGGGDVRDEVQFHV